MFRKLTLLLFVASLSFGSFAQDTTPAGLDEADQREYELFLTQNPYFTTQSLTPQQWKVLRKVDRPDSREEFEFQKTFDPALNRIPKERLWAARMRVQESINNLNNRNARSEAGIPNVKWVEKGPINIGGRTRAIMFDPNDATTKRVWAGGVAGGLWVNEDITDPNSKWKNIDDFWENLAVGAIAYDPSNPKIFYVGTGEFSSNFDAVSGGGIWKSDDAGKTWKRLASTIPANTNFNRVQKIVVNKQGIVFASTNNGLIRSADGGTTFTVAQTGNFTDLEIGTDGILFCVSRTNLYRSNDATGLAFTDISPAEGFSGSSRSEMALAPSTNGANQVVYAMANFNNLTNAALDIKWFKKSIDAGRTWTDVVIPMSGSNHFTNGQGWYNLVVNVHPENPDVLTVGGLNVHRSIDGGKTWATIGSGYHVDQHAQVSRPGKPSEMLIGNDGGIYYSTNVGDAKEANPSFSVRNTNYNVTQFYAIAMRNVLNDDYLVGGTQDNNTLKVNTQGDATGPAESILGGDGGFSFIDQDEPDIQIGTTQYSNFYLFSRTGSTIRNIVDGYLTGGFVSPSDYDNVNNTLYASYTAASIYRVKGVGTTNISDKLTFEKSLGSSISTIKVANAANTILVSTFTSKIFKVTDADKAIGKLARVDSITSNRITALGTISSIDIGSTDDTLLVTFSNYGVKSVWLTNDGGKNWTSKDDATHGLPDIPVRWAMFNPNNRKQVLLATEMGVWSTNDITAENPGWEVANAGLANVRCDMIRYRAIDGRIAVATHGRGAYISNIFAKTTPAQAIQTGTPSVLSVCLGTSTTVNVPFTTTGTFKANNTYVAYISDANGNFVRETSIGTGTSSPIRATIPTSLAAGTKYKIKVVSLGDPVNGKEIVEDFAVRNPTASILASASQVCTGYTSTLSTTSNPNFTYQWRKDGVDIVGAVTPEFVASLSGNYTVVVSQGVGCTATASRAVTVGSISASLVSTGAATTFCKGFSSLLQATNGQDYKFQWRKNGTNITGATNVTYNATETGTFSVEVSQGTCKSITTGVAITTTETVNTKVIAYGNQKYACNDGTANFVQLQFTDSNPNNYNSLQWQKDGVDIAGANTYYYNVLATGNYNLRIKQGDCESASTPMPIVVSDTVKVAITPPLQNILCTGTTTVLRASVVANILYQWQKDGVNITGATGQTYTASTAGKYTVRSTQGRCLATSDAVTLTFNASPDVPILSIGSNQMCESGGSAFMAFNAPTAGLTFQWKKDGVNIAGATSTSYNATQPGNYTLATKATGCDGLSQAIKVETVKTVPVTISADGPNTVCSNTFLTLQSAGGSGSYQWTKDGQNIAGAFSTSLSISQTGKYALVFKQGTCTTTTEPFDFKVTEKIDPTLSLDASPTLCTGGSITLKSNAVGTDYKYTWRSSGENIVGQTAATYKTNVAGIYSLFLSKGFCSSITNDVVVTVNPFPVATVSADGNTTICSGNGTNLKVTLTDGAKYQWRKDSINIANATNANFIATESGKYSVLVTSKANCSKLSDNTVMTVNPTPVTTLSNEGNTTFCNGGSTNLKVSLTDGAKYQWKKDTVNIASATNANFVATESGKYTVLVTSKDNCGKLSGNTVVTANPIPVATLTADGGTTICKGASSTLKVSLTDGAKYQWKKDTINIPAAITANFVANESGKYTVLVTSKDNCIKLSDALTFKVNLVPTATFSGDSVGYKTTPINLKVAFTEVGPWTFTLSDGQEFTTDQNPYSFTIRKDTSAVLTIRNVKNICGNGTATGRINLRVLAPLGTETNEYGLYAKIYPVPVHDKLQIELESESSVSLQIQLFDVNGKVLSDLKIAEKRRNHETQLDCSTLPAGTYLLRMSTEKGSITRKVLKSQE